MSTTRREAVETESHEDLIRFLRIFWERKTFVFLGLALGLLIGTLYYVRVKPVFQSTVRVLIIKKGPDVLPMQGTDPRMGYIDDYVGTQQVLIRSPAVLSYLVKNPKEDPKFKADSPRQQIYDDFQKLSFQKENPEKTIDQILANLSVLRGADKEKEGGTSAAVMGGGANVLTFVFRSANANDCSEVIRLLLDAYKLYLDETYKSVSLEAIHLIETAQVTQQKALAKNRKEYKEFVEKNPLLAMKRPNGKEGFAGVSDRYAALQDQQSALRLRKMDIESHLKSLDRATKSGKSRTVLKSMITRFDRMATDAGTRGLGGEMNLEENLFKLMMVESELSSKFGDDHGQLRMVRDEMKLIEKMITKRDQGKNNGPGEEDMISVHIELMHQELLDLDVRDENLMALMDKEKESAGQVIGDQIQLATMESEIAAGETLRQSIFDQLQKLDITKDSGGYLAENLSRPTAAFQVEPRATITFSLAAVAGLLVGLGLAYLTDLTDRSFRTPVDIARSLRMAVVGHVPVLTAKAGADQDSNLSPFLCTHHRPKSRDAEAFREIRTALYFNTRNTSCRKLQITSAASGDGKSTMASNLAISIAQSGKRVLLVDCDLRRPRIHTLFGLSNETGFSTVLNEQAEPADVTNADVIPGLSVIPAGPSLPNPAEILTSSRFHDCANLLAEKYDFVLFDTPPLLAVTDPAVIAPRMDGVFLVVRLGKRERNMAERSAEILRTLEANVIGVVVNAIGQDGLGYGGYGRYYYGRYSYYYGSGGYRYGNGYTYGNDGYYTDEDNRRDRIPLAGQTSNGHKAEPSSATPQDNEPNGEATAQAGSIKRAFRWFLGD